MSMTVDFAPMAYGSERNGSVNFFNGIDYPKLSNPQRPESFQLPTQPLAQLWVLFEKFDRLQDTPNGNPVEFAQISEEASG